MGDSTALVVGQGVAAHDGDDPKWFIAVVTAVSGDRCTVRFFDEYDRPDVKVADVMPAGGDLRVGDRVFACWKGLVMYPGVILNAAAGGFVVKWDAFETPLEVAAPQIARDPAAPRAPPATPAAPTRCFPPSKADARTLAHVVEMGLPGPPGFLRLLGPDLARAEPCLDAWSFLLPPERRWAIVGRNAYGALLLLEDRESDGAFGTAFAVLDPTMLWYWSYPRAGLNRLGPSYLGEGRLPYFLDADAFAAWSGAGGKALGDGEVLGIVKPLPLGGQCAPENFQVEPLLALHQRLAAACRAAFPAPTAPAAPLAVARLAGRAAARRAAPGLPQTGAGTGTASLLQAQLALVSHLEDAADGEPLEVWTSLTPQQEARAQHLYMLASGLLKTDAPELHAVARRALEHAATWRDGFAALFAGQMCMWGAGGPADQAKAEALLRSCQYLRDGQLEYARFLLSLPGRRAEAIPVLMKVAASRQGAAATYLLALCHFHGWGVTQDLVAARSLHEKAADAGVADAQLELAIFLDKGLGGPRDTAAARQWEAKAAAAGSARACLNMGTWAATGDGVPEDLEACVKWYEAAARAGDVRGAERLAVMYRDGAGVPRDEDRAAWWQAFGEGQREGLSVRP